MQLEIFCPLSFFGPTDEVRSYGFALVRLSVSQSVSQSVSPGDSTQTAH